ncbi:hypothetical protein [uncultured Albimonas sp.]|uniref:hypothetical protein n=1 Tax=uncultured Albimonas sp. TaxID=1331701 RepID=UPI0030EB77B0|tara:strand:- start:7853 stop:8086 length:234 start_codon:yes stop_codon:yes gene_type:complete
MAPTLKVVAVAREEPGARREILASTPLDHMGVEGDALMESCSARFGVSLERCRRPFHTGDEGSHPGSSETAPNRRPG